MSLIIGLTGGIACGKTTATDAFKASGVPVIDADVISHELTAPGGRALPQIAVTFGADMIGAHGLKRALMRETIFSDPAKRAQLEAILHPMIKREIFEQLKTIHAPYVILSIPLLLESGHWREAVSRVLVIDAPVEEQINRLVFERHMSADEAQAIIDTQVSREERLKAANDVIENNRYTTDLIKAVAELDRKYLALAEEAQNH